MHILNIPIYIYIGKYTENSVKPAKNVEPYIYLLLLFYIGQLIKRNYYIFNNRRSVV